ncbi:phospholipase A1 member A [Protopterus annectens]|uniref:phospholipase A1 member A n=1 Tax=Protopterus annectens TaxID=7888 RepID=UPI001CF985DB|nr:phospholipase A1 member A [Protopterus annectens]
MAQTATSAFLTLLFLTSLSKASEDDMPSNCSKLKKNSWRDYLRGSKHEIQFLLFTRENPECGQIFNDQAEILNSTFNSTLGTKFIIHGFRVVSTTPSWINGTVKALLHAADVNVVVVDFNGGATYSSFVDKMNSTSLQVSRIISYLIALGSTQDSIHLIGLSLGAHLAGFVGYLHGGRLGQITGLDPAGPQFTGASIDARLDPTDAIFVEAIHTDIDNLGIRIPVGHIDYFINGGKDQPACPSNPLSFFRYMTCDHTHAVHIYMNAIKAVNSSCHMFGIPCSSYEEFINGNCLDCFDPFQQSCPRIGLEKHGGITVEALPQQVKLYLMTSPTAPFCAYHSLIDLHSDTDRTKNTEVEIILYSKASTDKVTITVPKKTYHFKRVITHQEPLCNVHTLQLRYRVKLFSRLSGNKEENINIAKICIQELPFNDSEKTRACFINIHLPLNTKVIHTVKTECR